MITWALAFAAKSTNDSGVMMFSVFSIPADLLVLLAAISSFTQ